SGRPKPRLEWRRSRNRGKIACTNDLALHPIASATMRTPPPVRLGDLLVLLLILAGAAGVRSWYLCDAADCGSANGPVRVQADRQSELNELVESIRDHDGFASQA